MRPKTLILFIVAIGCGLVASIGVSQYLEKARGNGSLKVETMKIYVATTEINIGEKLDDKNIKLEEWPKERVPEGAITELKQLENMYPRTRFYKDEPILIAKLSDTIDGNKAQTIPAGFRVAAVKVSADTGGGGLIRPGDRVDVVVFLRKSAEVPETGTKTILRDVNVFAVDAETERAVDKGTGQSREVRTISLLVKPVQAESLMLAKELGIMSLTLRRPDEINEESTAGQTIQDLFGSDGDSANDKKNKGDQGGAGLAKWLSQANPQVVATTTAVPTPAPPAEEPAKFIMKIRTPNGNREYRWKDLNAEPEESGPAGSSPAAVTQPVSFPSAAPIVPELGPRTDTTESADATTSDSEDGSEPVSEEISGDHRPT